MPRAHGFSVPAWLLAIAELAAGALAGGWLIDHLDVNRGRLLALAASIDAVLAAAPRLSRSAQNGCVNPTEPTMFRRTGGGSHVIGVPEEALGQRPAVGVIR